MRIIPICFTCERDNDLFELMKSTLGRYVETPVTSFPGVGNGAGWIATMHELNCFREVLRNDMITDNDYIMKIDSDAILVSGELFNHLDGSALQGLKGDADVNTRLGKLIHMSGACIFMKAGILRKILRNSGDWFEAIRQNDFKAYDITENEDIILSYLCYLTEPTYKDLPHQWMQCGDIVKVLQGFDRDKYSLVHLNIEIKEFMGESVNGKWDIPKILKLKNISL